MPKITFGWNSGKKNNIANKNVRNISLLFIFVINQILKSLANLLIKLNPSGRCQNDVNLVLWHQLTSFWHLPSGFNKFVINLKLACQLILKFNTICKIILSRNAYYCIKMKLSTNDTSIEMTVLPIGFFTNLLSENKKIQ